MEEVCVESFCKEKIVPLCKKTLPDLIASKMPGLKKKKKACLSSLYYTDRKCVACICLSQCHAQDDR